MMDRYQYQNGAVRIKFLVLNDKVDHLTHAMIST